MAARITSVEDEQDIVMSCESSSYDEDETYGDDEGDTPTDSEIDPDMRERPRVMAYFCQLALL